MALSKERMRIRKRVDRAKAKGEPVKLSQTDEFLSLPLYKRKEVLAGVALRNIDAPVTAGHVIAAIKELNLMDHVYDEIPGGGDVTYNIFIAGGEDGKAKLKQLLTGEIPLLEGERDK